SSTLCSINNPATPHIYTLSLHDALPISRSSGIEQACRFQTSLQGWGYKSDRYRCSERSSYSCRRASSTYFRNPSGITCTSSFKRSEEHTSELQSRENLVCRLLLEKKKKK